MVNSQFIGRSRLDSKKKKKKTRGKKQTHEGSGTRQVCPRVTDASISCKRGVASTALGLPQHAKYICFQAVDFAVPTVCFRAWLEINVVMLYEPNETVWLSPLFIWIPEVFSSAPAAYVALRQYATNLCACAVRLRLKLPSCRDRSPPQLCAISARSQTLPFQRRIYEIWVSVTVENREGMNPFSNESSCHTIGWVLIIPHGVFSISGAV